MNTDSIPDQETLIAWGRDLIARVDAEARPFRVRGPRMTNEAQVPFVHGLSQHALRLGAVVLDLYEQDLGVEAMPTVRSLFECAITAQWAAQSREGVTAMYNEEVRHRRRLSETMSKSESAAFREFAPNMPGLELETIDTAAHAQGKWFEQRCLALEPVGHQAYAIFRAMSSYCHPSVHLTELYMAPADKPERVSLLTEPDQFEHVSWLSISVSSMVWAARALDMMRSDHPSREYLRSLARQLRIPVELQLTWAARKAELEKQQQRRHAEWKGPKPKGTKRSGMED